MDLEMTGLDPDKDRILEVACVATDWNFTEISTFESVIKVRPSLAKKRMTGDFWQKYSIVRDALLKQNLEQGRPASTIEKELLEFLDTHFDLKRPIYLAGNSIHQDRKFIANEWSELDARLHYRMLDVSAWKIVFENKYNKKFTKPETHRALDDIRGSIDELKYYLKDIK